MLSHAVFTKIANVLSLLAAVAGAFTAIAPGWIEVVFRVDPDQHSSATEVAVAIALGVAALGLQLLARRHKRPVESGTLS